MTLPTSESASHAETPTRAIDVLRAIEYALTQGVSPAMILDENSPLRGCMRDVLRPGAPLVETTAEWLMIFNQAWMEIPASIRMAHAEDEYPLTGAIRELAWHYNALKWGES